MSDPTDPSRKLPADARLPLTSADPNAERLARLRELFPEAFAEGELDLSKLGRAVGAVADDRPERYGLSWAGKSDAIRAFQTASAGTLLPVPSESVNFDTTENVIIEGDNLEVLKLLQRSYHDRVKMIYIDPPYNTGNEFIYPDNFREGLQEYLRFTGQVDGEGVRLTTNAETDGRYHSRWLSMMYPRLFLARNLLREDGVIFVSIDDHEVHNLRLLMNEIFGEENFIAELVWEKGRKNDAKLFSVGHEYMLTYGRSVGFLKESGTVWRESKPGASEVIEEYRRLRLVHGGKDVAIELALQEWYRLLPNSHPSKKLSRYKHVDRYGPWRDRDISWPGGGGPRYDVLHPSTGYPCEVPERGWGFSKQEEMQRQIELGLVEFRDDHTKPPFRKAHLLPIAAELDEVESDDDGSRASEDEEQAGLQVMGSVVYKQAQVSVKYLRKLMDGKRVFENPKDHEVVARLIRYCTSRSDTILDFFAGSGTTAQAVLELNKEDGGSRKFILVQLPEPTGKDDFPTIADITKERVRRVIQKLEKPEGGTLALDDSGPQDLGFRVFKLSSSSFTLWDADAVPRDPDALGQQLELYADHVAPGRSELDILYEMRSSWASRSPRR